MCGIFNILGWKFGVPHKRGHPRIFPDALPEKMFFRIFKKSKRSENGHTGVARIRTYEGIFELNSMFHNPAPKNILGYREPEFVSKNMFFLRSEAKVARFRRQKNV